MSVESAGTEYPRREGSSHVLETIRIRDFKSYQSAELRLSPLTLLIGANASGKSNALEAIRLLAWLASGRRLDDLMLDVQETSQLIRGTVVSLPYPGKDAFGLGCHVEIGDWTEFRIRIRVGDEGMRVIDEEISGPSEKVPLYSVVEPAGRYSHEMQVQYNNFARGGVKPRIPCTDQQAVFTQLETPARFVGSHKKAQSEIPNTAGALRSLLENIIFIDPSPRQMRDYAYKSERQLKGNASNVSSVLWHLCEKENRREEVLTYVRSLPEQNITGIDFLETERNEVMVRLTESFGSQERKWDAGNLSDGTLRVLAVAAALLSAPEDSLVIVEEIDNGVHPSRANTLLTSIQETAAQRSLRVLVTTHNPALLDALPKSAIPDVVYCFRDPKTGESRLTRLEDAARYPDLIARGPLGDLMTSGWIERFLKEDVAEMKSADRASAWVRGLRDAPSGR